MKIDRVYIAMVIHFYLLLQHDIVFDIDVDVYLCVVRLIQIEEERTGVKTKLAIIG